MNVPYQAAKKGLIAPTLPGRAKTLPCPTCILGRLDSSRTNPYAVASTLPAALAGKKRVLARLGLEGEITDLFEQTELCTYGFHVHFG